MWAYSIKVYNKDFAITFNLWWFTYFSIVILMKKTQKKQCNLPWNHIREKHEEVMAKECYDNTIYSFWMDNSYKVQTVCNKNEILTLWLFTLANFSCTCVPLSISCYAPNSYASSGPTCPYYRVKRNIISITVHDYYKTIHPREEVIQTLDPTMITGQKQSWENCANTN